MQVQITQKFHIFFVIRFLTAQIMTLGASYILVTVKIDTYK